MPGSTPPVARRADAARNRDRILAVAREAFGAAGPPPSMAEVARRAGVGMATLYRNFPGRRELLEALYLDEVEAVVGAGATAAGATPGAVLHDWLGHLAEFFTNKHPIASDLLASTDQDESFLNANRDRVLAAGRPLLAAAQRSGEVRSDLDLEQICDMIIAVAGISGPDGYTEPILRAALDGLRPLDTERGASAR